MANEADLLGSAQRTVDIEIAALRRMRRALCAIGLAGIGVRGSAR